MGRTYQLCSQKFFLIPLTLYPDHRELVQTTITIFIEDVELRAIQYNVGSPQKN